MWNTFFRQKLKEFDAGKPFFLKKKKVKTNSSEKMKVVKVRNIDLYY